MEFKDKRKGRIVYVSQCLLNQNLRFPGIAVAPGACTDLVELFLKNGLGIEPIPCLERLDWGGVSRRDYFRFQPLALKYAGTPYFLFIRPFVALWLARYRLLCTREARKIAGQMADYIKSGYSIVGIVAADDSPTDGVTKTIDLSRAAARLVSMGVSQEVMTSPRIEEMRTIIPRLCEQGTGIFTVELKRELERKKTPIRIVGFDPWTDPKAETERIKAELDL
jgi:hypothetical protein